MGCGFGWFVGPKFLVCGGFDWVGSVVWWAGLGWVEKIGPTDNFAATTQVWISPNFQTACALREKTATVVRLYIHNGVLFAEYNNNRGTFSQAVSLGQAGRSDGQSPG